MGKQIRAGLQVGVFFLTLLGGMGCASTPDPVKAKELSHTERARMFIEIANGALVEGDPTGALQSLASAEQEDSHLPDLYHSKALAYYGKKMLPEALAAAKRSIEIKPNYSDAHNTYGRLLSESGRMPEAIAQLKIAGADPLYRDSYKAWTNLGLIKYRQGDQSEAETFLSRAIQDSPMKSCVAYQYLGHVKLSQRRFDEAIRNYEMATHKFCAGFGDAQLSLGQAYEQNNQPQLARQTFVEIQKRFPNTKLSEQALVHLRSLP